MPSNVRIAEDLPRLDIYELFRAGALKPGARSTFWLRNGDPGGYQAQADKLGLTVKAAHEVCYLPVDWIRVIRTPQGVIGATPAFRCSCGRHPRFAYAPSFTCWKCAWRDTRTDWAIRRTDRYIPACTR
jgi:hypothetical protein